MKQTRTTLKALTAAYRAVLRHGILCNAIALGLIAGPIYAGAPNTTGDAWVFGDATFTGDFGNQHVANGQAAFGGRRLADSTVSGKYHNVFPEYNMTGQSFALDNSDAYFGPINLTLGDLGGKSFAFNWQAPDNDVNADMDIAAAAGINFGDSLEDITTKLTTKMTEIFTAKGLTGDDLNNAVAEAVGGAAGPIYVMSRDDGDASNDGTLSLSYVDALIDGSTITADTISVTNGSKLTFVKQDIDRLNTSSTFYTAKADIDSTGVTTLNTKTMTANASRMVVNSGAELNINATNGSTFTNSSTDTNGGAIYNKGTLALNDSTFDGNTATGTYTSNQAGTAATYSNGAGGAIYNAGNLTVGGTFENNTAFSGGAIRNLGTLKIDNDSSFDGNYADIAGGAIYNSGTLNVGENVTFSNNTSLIKEGMLDSASGGSEMGAAIYSEGTATSTKTVVIGDETKFVDNTSAGGALYFYGANNVTIGDNIEFSGNNGVNAAALRAANNGSNGYASITIGDNVSFTNNEAVYASGIMSGAGSTINIGENAVFSNNIGTAIRNNGSLTFGANATFSDNESTSTNEAGALRNTGTATFDGASFVHNKTNSQGGAIYNKSGAMLNLNANSGDVVFSGNTANGLANDIYNAGTVALNAASGKTISLAGGIDGDAGTLNITGTGMVEIANALKNQTVTHEAGELHLNNADLTGSAIDVASGAVINTIDDVIQDLSSVVTLADGAGIMGDIDFENGIADKYASDAGMVTYKMGNLIGVVGSDTKNIQVASDGTTVNKGAGFGWFNSVTGLTLESSGAADGMIKLTGWSGGIAEAADASATVNETNYDVTADEALTTSKSFQNNVVLNGNGTGASGKELELVGADLTVADGADVTINDLKLAGNGALNNAATAIMRINDSLVGVKLRNAGILYSDPTTYTDTLINTGIANIDGDTFASTGKLENYNVANLKDATFDADAEILGSGTANLVSGTTAFNNTVNTNTVHVASGADFTGALVGGTLDTHNGTIDTVSGSFSGGNVVLDAKLGTTNTADSIAGNTGTIKEINILGTEYGTADSATLTTGGTLDSNVQINGMNYYTSVVDNGDGTVTFSDKLVNTSGMNTAIDSALVDTALTGNTTAENLTVGGNAVLTTASSLDGSKLADASVGYDALSTDVQSAIDKANSALQAGANISTLTNDAGYQTASDVSNAITSALGTSGAITGAINDKIDAAVGDRSSYTEHNIIANGESVATSLDKLDMAVADKQDAIIDNDFIIADGTGGLKVKDAAIGTTQLDSTVNDALTKANSAVQSVSTGSANGTINVDGTEVSVAGWSTKQDVISDTTTIVKDGTGLKVANGSIGATQLDTTVNASLAKANSAVQSVAEGSANGTISVDGTDVAVHGLGSAAYADANAFDAAGSATAAQNAAIAYTDAQLGLAKTETLANANAYTDQRIETLDKDLSAGVAGAVALSSVAVSGVERGEVSVGAGYGYFNGQSAAAFGATMGLSNRWSINAGAGISNADVSFRAGTNYKFKLF